MDDRSVTFSVNEHDLKFDVNLSDYLDTGLFLDHRQTRAMVRGDAAGRSFLNLFGYTGSFSVAAAAGGAEGTAHGSALSSPVTGAAFGRGRQPGSWSRRSWPPSRCSHHGTLR